MVAMSHREPPIEPSAPALVRGAQLSAELAGGAALVLGRAARLGTEPGQLFRFIADFERLPEWMPMMRRCRVDNSQAVVPGGVGAVRIIDSGFGEPTRETVRAFEPPQMLAYSASDASLRGLFTGHLGVLVCEPHPAGGSWLSWLSYARSGAGPQKFLGPSVVKMVIQRSLASLSERFPLPG
jgi:uncharacterized protein YndB with AHSA1/START domain